MGERDGLSGSNRGFEHSSISSSEPTSAHAAQIARGGAAPSLGGIVIITGATGGIGTALTHLHVAAGHDVLLVARNADRLAALKSAAHARAQTRGADASGAQHAAIDTLVIDLAQADCGARLADWLTADGRPVAMLINNAAWGHGGALAQASLDEAGLAVDLNCRAMALLTRAVLPRMLARGDGAVVNVASMAGLLSLPDAALYSATKAFVINFSKALRAELIDSGVRVSVVVSGPVRTPMMADLGLAQWAGARALAMTPDLQARAIHDGVAAGRFMISPGFANMASTYILRALPEALVSSVWGAIWRVSRVLTTRRPRAALASEQSATPPSTSVPSATPPSTGAPSPKPE